MVKWFFPTQEAMDNWDEYWKIRKEKKNNIKQEKAETKALKKQNMKKTKIICEPESAFLVDEPEGQVLKAVCFEVIEGQLVAQPEINMSTEKFSR